MTKQVLVVKDRTSGTKEWNSSECFSTKVTELQKAYDFPSVGNKEIKI